MPSTATPGSTTEEQHAHLRLAAEISRAFAGGSGADLDAIVVEALRLLGIAVGVDVAYVNTLDDEFLTGAWEWTAWGGPGRPAQTGERIDEVYAPIIEALHLGVVVSIADIPAMGMPPNDAARFDAIDARSVLMAPIRLGGRLAGTASFLAVGRTIEWTDDHAAALRFHGELMVGAVGRLQERSSRSLERRRTAHIAAKVTDALLFTDEDARIRWTSPSAGRVLGYAPGWLGEQRLQDLAADGHRDELARIVRAAWAGEPGVATLLLRRADGHERWFEVSAARAEDDEEPELLVTVRDVHARQLEVAELADLALNDALTGLLNRRGLRRALAGLGDGDVPAQVVFVDLDHFKAVNDAHGHAIGDEVLAAVAERLRRLAGDDGLAARLGGDEFVLVLPRAAIERVPAAALEQALGRPVPTSAGALAVGASLGVGRMTTPDDAANAIGEADAAMYRAKRARR